MKAFLRERTGASFRVLYQPIIPPPGPPRYDKAGRVIPEPDYLGQHFAAVVTIAIACGRLILVIDEVDRVTSAGYAPPGLDYVINQGRHVQISLACTSRRPAQIPRELTSQAHRMVIFRMTEPGDLDYIEKYAGGDVRSNLPMLGDYEYIEWEESTGTRRGGGREKKLLNSGTRTDPPIDHGDRSP